MLEIGWTEILVIAIVMIVVVGPKDLPKMLRTFGRTTAKMRSMAGEFRKQFDEAVKEAELDEVRNLASEARKLNPASQIRKAMSPMEMAAQDVKAGLDGAMKSKPAPASSVTASQDAAAVAAEPLKAGATAMPAAAAATPDPVAAAPARPDPVAAPPKPAARKPAAPQPAAVAAGAAKPVKADAKPKAPAKPRAAAKPKPPKGGTTV